MSSAPLPRLFILVFDRDPRASFDDGQRRADHVFSQLDDDDLGSARARAALLTCVSQREVMRTALGWQRQEAEGTENSGCGDDQRHSTRRPLTEFEMTD